MGHVHVKWHDREAEQADDQALLEDTVEVVRLLKVHGHTELAEQLDTLREKGDSQGIRLEIRGLRDCLSAFAGKAGAGSSD
jgi:hypothetical protein